MTQKNKAARASLPVGSILMRAAGVLLCLVLFSLHLMGGLYARYTSNGEAEDEARVAKFEVNVVGASNAVDVTCTQSDSDSLTYIITLENRSEVAVAYTLSGTVTSGTPGVSLSFDSAAGTMVPGAAPVTRTMTLTVNWAQFTADKNGTSASVTVNFSVTVHVEQVD